MASEQQRDFGQNKLDSLPQYCLACDVRFVCNGGCPKNRFIETPDGEPGLNYLCDGYRHFFRHIEQPIRVMAQELQQGRSASRVMSVIQQVDQELAALFQRAKQNEP